MKWAASRTTCPTLQPVVAGFSTHPDWDHVLWHAKLGEAPCTQPLRGFMRDLLSNADWKARVAEGLPPEIAEEIPLDLFGLITGLPAESAQIPWDGPHVRIIGIRRMPCSHAALLIEDRGVLVAGDMLSNVLIPFLDLDAPMTRSRTISLGCGCSRAWRTTLMFSSQVTGQSAELIRCAHDRTGPRMRAGLADAHAPIDPRIGPSSPAGKVSDSHTWQAHSLAQKTRTRRDARIGPALRHKMTPPNS